MKRAQQIPARLVTSIMAVAASIGLATSALAAGGGASANVGAGSQAGATAGTHMSPSGAANTNAQWQAGATQGADRAADRMSPYGAEMKQAGDAEAAASGKAVTGNKR